ncbi:unnamed protein product [Penicillium salamii]|nr:unnamed protein product [Penicillium salamii]
MPWPEGTYWEDVYVHEHPFEPLAQHLPPTPDLGWSASPENGGGLPNDVPVAYLSPFTLVNPLGTPGSTGAMSPNVAHPQNTLFSGVAVPHLPQEPTEKPRGRNNTRTKKSQTSGSPPDNTGNDKLRCKWEGCGYKGTFERETSLIRHIRKLHISPLAHPCLVPGCSKTFNRADNLTQHTRNTHYSY